MLCARSDQDDEEKPPEATAPKTPVATEAPSIDRKRNTSVISKKSTGVESTQLSRVGSVHDAVRKQESTVSQAPQGTGTRWHGSTPSLPPPCPLPAFPQTQQFNLCCQILGRRSLFSLWRTMQLRDFVVFQTTLTSGWMGWSFLGVLKTLFVVWVNPNFGWREKSYWGAMDRHLFGNMCFFEHMSLLDFVSLIGSVILLTGSFYQMLQIYFANCTGGQHPPMSRMISSITQDAISQSKLNGKSNCFSIHCHHVCFVVD